LIICLFKSGVVKEVLDQMASALRRGQILIDTTTGEPGDVTAMGARLAELGVHYFDAPISGSSEQTRRGEATVIVGGEPQAFEACADLWPVLGGTVFHVGGCGAASKMKLVTNLVLGLNRAALAEGLVFAEAVGIDASSALEVLRGSVAYSKTMDTKGQKMIDRAFQPQARLTQHLKDVRLILAAAERSGLSLPLSQRHAELLAQAEQLGCGDLDNSAIIEVYRRRSPDHA
jgi:3-hydroxyisobutyrate dehydrogenase-like beta-hydroxyacid dehydrogenase